MAPGNYLSAGEPRLAPIATSELVKATHQHFIDWSKVFELIVETIALIMPRRATKEQS